MNILSTKIPGVYIIESAQSTDNRGTFTKVFHKETFNRSNLNTDFNESFYSKSHKGVIRGMHVQIPPKDLAKLVYVTNGSVIDVVLDIRKDSPTYGEFIQTELSSSNNRSVYIPPGCAHGFISLEDDTCMVYLQSATYSPEHDIGIHFDSFSMNWPIDNPIVSERDLKLIPFDKFDSPFIFKQ